MPAADKCTSSIGWTSMCMCMRIMSQRFNPIFGDADRLTWSAMPLKTDHTE